MITGLNIYSQNNVYKAQPTSVKAGFKGNPLRTIIGEISDNQKAYEAMERARKKNSPPPKDKKTNIEGVVAQVRNSIDAPA